jgi:tetratricopeptide (TPR) repeat protein
MLELPGVTLCCVDTRNHALALRALRQSAAQIRFGRTLFITDRDFVEAGIDVRVIAPLHSRDAYSEFVLRSLRAHVDTPHVLLVQWDGYVVNAAAWRAEYLDCDYIGATWFWHDDSMRVGNGGFSLRSRKLLDALQDPRIVLTEAEDVTICRAFRPLLERDYGIRFASEALANAFAFEAAYPIGMPFGFHGLFNFSRVVPADELTGLVVHFTPAIARAPQLLQLGRNCLAMRMWRPAAAIFQRILDETPGHAEAEASLATATVNAAAPRTAGRNDPCPCGSGKRYKNCHGALAQGPTPADTKASSADARVRQALALHQRGDTAAAEAIYREVLVAVPDHPQAQHFLGVIHYQRRELDAALPLLERSVEAVANEPEFHNNLGLALAAADREADAIAAYRAALALKTDHAVAWNNLGLALQAVNDVVGAIAAFQRAVQLKPEFAQAHWNLALALLLDRQFAQGWREYDWRLKLAELGKTRHVFPGPVWDGTAPAGKTLLIYAEQGLGDALQFARYLTPLADAGARCVVHCQEPLRALLATVPGVAAVVSNSEALPPYDAQMALMSLPRVFKTTLATIPAHVPYIVAAPERRAVARALLRTRSGLKAGLAWAGSRDHANDRNRSCPLALLGPLFELNDIEWYSLQQGDASAQIAAVGSAQRMVPLPVGAPLADTAALIAELDLVITVDTSIAHLAGALGQSAWVLLPFAPDWRWLLDRDDSPWYPTLRLFRQPQPRDWPSVVTRLVAALQALQGAGSARS